jgi:hypothetical protein
MGHMKPRQSPSCSRNAHLADGLKIFSGFMAMGNVRIAE